MKLRKASSPEFLGYTPGSGESTALLQEVIIQEIKMAKFAMNHGEVAACEVYEPLNGLWSPLPGYSDSLKAEDKP